MQVNVHEAKTQLSKLIEAALRGEEVIIARNGKPVVKVEPLAKDALPSRKGKFKFGIIPELVGTVPPLFFGPGSEDYPEDRE